MRINSLPRDLLTYAFSFCDLQTLVSIAAVNKVFNESVKLLFKPYGEAKILLNFYIFRNLNRNFSNDLGIQYVTDFQNYIEKNSIDYTSQKARDNIIENVRKVVKKFIYNKIDIKFSPEHAEVDLNKMIHNQLNSNRKTFWFVDLPQQVFSNQFYQTMLPKIKAVGENLIYSFSQTWIKDLDKIAQQKTLSEIIIPLSLFKNLKFIEELEKVLPKCRMDVEGRFTIILDCSQKDELNNDRLPVQAIAKIFDESHTEWNGCGIVTQCSDLTDIDVEDLCRIIELSPKIFGLRLCDERNITNAGLKRIAETVGHLRRRFTFALDGYTTDLTEGVGAVLAAQNINRGRFMINIRKIEGEAQISLGAKCKIKELKSIYS